MKKYKNIYRSRNVPINKKLDAKMLMGILCKLQRLSDHVISITSIGE